MVMRAEMLMSLNSLFDYLLLRLNNGLELRRSFACKLIHLFNCSLVKRLMRHKGRIIVYSRTEIGFDMKCGPIFRERI